MRTFQVVQYGHDDPSPSQGEQVNICVTGRIDGDRLVLTGRKASGKPFQGEGRYYRVLTVEADCREGLDEWPTQATRGVQGVGTPQITVTVDLKDTPVQSFCIVREVSPEMKDYDLTSPTQKSHWRSLWIVVEQT